VISRALNVHARVQGDTGGRPASFAATRVGPALTEQRVVVRPGNQLAAAQHPPGGSNHGADHCGAR
jgi:hypothetical protein